VKKRGLEVSQGEIKNVDLVYKAKVSGIVEGDTR
jgi:hypothetical protein